MHDTYHRYWCSANSSLRMPTYAQFCGQMDASLCPWEAIEIQRSLFGSFYLCPKKGRLDISARIFNFSQLISIVFLPYFLFPGTGRLAVPINANGSTNLLPLPMHKHRCVYLIDRITTSFHYISEVGLFFLIVELK